MNSYKLLIAGLRVALFIESDAGLPESFSGFHSSFTCKADIEINVSFILPDFINEIKNSGRLHELQFTTYYRYEGKLYTYFEWGGRIILSEYTGKNSSYVYVWTNLPIVDEALLSRICFEQFIIHYDGLFMHSSFIQTAEGEGILFLAKSGGGKSTQADLWEKYGASEIINGDKSAIRIENDNAFVYGLPWAGTSNIYTNKKVRLKALVCIEKSDNNSVLLLNRMDAVKKIISFSYAPIWYSDYFFNAFDIAEKIAEKAEVLVLSCIPEKSAVDCLKKYLKGN